MKKNWIKLASAAFGTTVLLCLPLTAAAETSGYWTMETDEEGRQVMIYTYTSLDDITYEPVEGMTPSDEVDNPAEDPSAVSTVQKEASEKAQQPRQGASGRSTGSVNGLTIMGVLSLAGLAAVLYKII